MLITFIIFVCWPIHLPTCNNLIIILDLMFSWQQLWSVPYSATRCSAVKQKFTNFFSNVLPPSSRLKILYRVGGTCGGLQSTPPNYLTIILLPITTPVLQSLQYTEYRAVCRRPFSFEAHFELTYILSPWRLASNSLHPFSLEASFELFMCSLFGGRRITSYIFPPWCLA
jgi:hypothetical protein